MSRPAVIEVKEVTHYEYYDVRVNIMDPGAMGVIPDPGEKLEPIEMTSAYSKEGKYLGNPKTAAMLVKKFEITSFETAMSDHNVCSIGFSSKRNKWYGWSHRAIYGFTIGSTCRKGDSHYVPNSFSEIGRTCWMRKGDKCHALASYYYTDSVDINAPNGLLEAKGPLRGVAHCTVENCVIEIGRGEWAAKTMEDAKLMAIDFARSVS